MSRNLCQTACRFCGDYPKLDEPPRPITEADCGSHYLKEYRGLNVANATCPSCEAKYLAWVDWPGGHGCWRLREYDKSEGKTHTDLSFRSSFNDEPGLEDLPKWKIEFRRERVDRFLPDAEGYGYLLKLRTPEVSP